MAEPTKPVLLNPARVPAKGRRAPAPVEAATAVAAALAAQTVVDTPVVIAPAPAEPPAKPTAGTLQTSSSTPTAEGPPEMATTAETILPNGAAAATDKLQSVFADAQSRAKASFEKGARFYEELGEFTKGNVEALIASSKIAGGAFESLGQDAVAYGRKSAEDLTATVKSLASAKSPTEFFQLHSDWARKAIDSYVAEGSRTSEKLVKLAGEVAQPISSRLSLAAEKVKTAAL